jgi:peroxiredoxin Q/BCP
VGGEPLSSVDLTEKHDAVLVVLLRSHYCPLCRDIVQSLADEYHSFASRSTAVVPVLPDQVERGAVWQRRYELPFPIISDPDESAAEDEEPAYDAFAPYQRLIRELPGAVLFRAGEDGLELVTAFGGDGGRDFPSVEELLAEVEANTEAASAGETGPRADS